MENIINVFSRHEIKYIVDEGQRRLIMKAVNEHMVPDPHGKSTICNVYYDTPDYLLIRRSLDKPIYKEKIRLRSYGTPAEGDIVFLELKKKYDGVVYKRRVELSEEDATEYMERNIEGWLPVDTQIGREIDYFKHFYKNLQPMVYLSYERCAYFSNVDPSLRITFDKNICWRKERIKLTEEPGGKQLLKKGTYLMEIKTATALPIWLAEILSEAGAVPASFSKYGRAYEEIMGFHKEDDGIYSEKVIPMPMRLGNAEMNLSTAKAI